MENTRQEKISRLLQKDLGELLRVDARGIMMGAMVTVTKVTVSRDFSSAKVYLSVFGSKDKELLFKNIEKRKSDIRFKLGQKVRHQLRIIPNLYFYEDDSLDYIENIDRLLNED